MTELNVKPCANGALVDAYFDSSDDTIVIIQKDGLAAGYIDLKEIPRPLQKPLTLEEAMDGKEPGVCVEHKVPRCIYYAFVSDSEFEGMCNIESIGRSTPCIARIADYGKEWRCWSTKPTQEEREAAEWEE